MGQSAISAIVPSPGWFDIQGTFPRGLRSAENEDLCSAVFAMAFDHFPAHIECVLVVAQNLDLRSEVNIGGQASRPISTG